MTFFFDRDLNRRRFDDVVRISPCRQEEYGGAKRSVHHLEMVSGEMLILLDFEVAALLRTPVKIFPAEPDLLALVGQTEEDGFLTAPVLAWAVTAGGAVCPITAGGVNDDQDGELPIVYPNGSVRYIGFNEYPSIEAYWNSGADKPSND